MLIRMLRDIFGPPSPEARDACVLFVADVRAPVRVLPGSALHSSQAGFRLRTMMAARGIAARIAAWIVPPALAASPGGLQCVGETRLIVVSKFMIGRLLAEPDLFRGVMRALDGSTLPAVADVTDDFTAIPVAASPQRAFAREWQDFLARRCHLAVTTATLRDTLLRVARHGVSIVEDPYEWDRLGAWRPPSEEVLRLCWFGNAAPETCPPVEQALRRIADRFPDRRISVEIVSTARWELFQAIAAGLATRPGMSFRFTEWSLQATWDALQRADFVLLPHDVSSEWVRAKSHNRLAAAIAAGRLAIASPLPAYRELADGAWVGDDPAEGIAWALSNPAAAGARVAAGQRLVEARFSPAATEAKWRALLTARMQTSEIPSVSLAHG